jgi:NAD(P)-dependent dehydrogenase (short-subunit alcohol dehydrogenase family)
MFNDNNSLVMETILITGANRGIGLEFCKQYAHSGHTVFACCRKPKSANVLANLAQQYPNVKLLPLDLSNGDSIDKLAVELSGQSIDVLINNAAVYGDDNSQGFGKLDYQLWQDVFTVNTLASVRMTEALLPNLLAGNKKLVVAITSKMGSIADNSSGGCLLYRSSKAGLNAAMKSLSFDLAHRGVGVLILHPGWVQTDMGGPHALITSQQSVAGMLELINGFSMTDSGQFVDYTGKQVPW